jgi:hypothetical protein
MIRFKWLVCRYQLRVLRRTPQYGGSILEIFVMSSGMGGSVPSDLSNYLQLALVLEVIMIKEGSRKAPYSIKRTWVVNKLYYVCSV